MPSRPGGLPVMSDPSLPLAARRGAIGTGPPGTSPRGSSPAESTAAAAAEPQVGLGGVVLAGGAGRRMGRPKAEVALHGQRLVDRAVHILARWCSPIVVVTRPEVPLETTGPVRGPVASGSPAICHDRPGWSGPLGALATGLAALGTEQVIVLACDLPLAGPAVEALAAWAMGEDPDVQAVVTVDGAGRLQGLCARYRRGAVLRIAEELLGGGERRLGALLDELHPLLITFPGDELTNVNTWADLDRVTRRADRPSPPGGPS